MLFNLNLQRGGFTVAGPQWGQVATDERGARNDYVAWFDGACEPINPGGTATSGAIVKDNEGTVLLAEGRLVGKGEGMSNNVAEYAAIIRVFEYLISRPPGHVMVYAERGDGAAIPVQKDVLALFPSVDGQKEFVDGLGPERAVT